MSLFRASARTMLASYFVVSGVKALRDPEALVPAAEPIVDTIVPLIKQYAPAEVGDRVPEDTVTLIRIEGALQLVGGLALATGKGRRLGAVLLAVSLVPSTVAKHPFWTRSTAEEKAADRDHFLKNISLLGGVLLAARDTEGRPGLGYRARKTTRALTRDSKRTSKKLSKTGHEIADQSRELAEGALAGGSLLVGSVVATSRKARKQAAKNLKKNKKIAGKQLAQASKLASAAAKDAQKAATKAAKRARKKGGAFVGQTLRDGSTLAGQVRKDGGKLIDQARKDGGKALDKAVKQAQDQVEQARKSAAGVAKNIQLGDN